MCSPPTATASNVDQARWRHNAWQSVDSTCHDTPLGQKLSLILAAVFLF